MNKVTLALAAAALLAPGLALARAFTELDAGSNGVLSQEEWNAGLAETGVFDTWDGNDDGVVSAVEYEDGLFGWIDDDDDDALSISEWDEGVDAWFGETATDFDVSAWDDDGDGLITEEEFDGEYTTTGLFEDFTSEVGVETAAAEEGDATGVREQDFYAGLFDWFDADDDTGIIADEAGWFG